MTTDTIQPDSNEEQSEAMSPKDFRETFNKVSRLLEPLCRRDRKRALEALALVLDVKSYV